MLLVALALAAGAIGDRPNAAERKVIVGEVGDQLADGVTAQWRWPAFSPGGKAWIGSTYCGWVNAKNKFGAYVGFRPYMIVAERIHPPKFTASFGGIVGSSEIMDAHITKACAEAGYDLLAPPPAD